jgi:hypothetical protein
MAPGSGLGRRGEDEEEEEEEEEEARKARTTPTTGWALRAVPQCMSKLSCERGRNYLDSRRQQAAPG